MHDRQQQFCERSFGGYSFCQTEHLLINFTSSGHIFDAQIVLHIFSSLQVNKKAHLSKDLRKTEKNSTPEKIMIKAKLKKI